jgi:hypothetical protein
VPLQLGTWTINVAGAGTTTFQIMAVDSQGNLTGQVGAFPFTGFWDELAQKLTVSLVSAESPIVLQILVGYFFTDSVNLLGVTGSVIFTLTGYVENFVPVLNLVVNGPAVTAKQSVFGWYAQIGVD